MNTDTGEIRALTEDEVKARPAIERARWIALGDLTDEELEALFKMSFTERRIWVGNQRNLGRTIPRLKLTGDV